MGGVLEGVEGVEGVECMNSVREGLGGGLRILMRFDISGFDLGCVVHVFLTVYHHHHQSYIHRWVRAYFISFIHRAKS